MRISDWSSDVCSSDLLPEALMLGVKAQKLDEVAEAIAPRIKGVPLLLSILAGVDVAALAQRYEAKAIVRVMPNLPARKSVVAGKRVAVRVDHGGRRLIKNNKTRHDSKRSSHATWVRE